MFLQERIRMDDDKTGWNLLPVLKIVTHALRMLVLKIVTHALHMLRRNSHFGNVTKRTHDQCSIMSTVQ